MLAFEYFEINFTPFYCSIELFGSYLLNFIKKIRCYFGMRSHAISVQHTVPPYSVPGYDLGERRQAPLRIIKKHFQLGWVRLVAERSEATKEPGFGTKPGFGSERIETFRLFRK